MEPLKLVIVHVMQRHFLDILRCVTVNIVKALNGFLMMQTDDLESVYV